MNRALLDRLLKSRAGEQAAVLVTEIASGRQALIADDGVLGEIELTPAMRQLADEARRHDRSGLHETTAGQVFVQVFNPRLRLVVVGAVHIAQALAPMALLAGYAVTIVDPRRAFATDERFPQLAISRDWPDEALTALKLDHRSAVVTLTHDPKLDDPALDVALKSPAFYIAALGSRRTHAARLERLKALGHDAAALERIHGPAGIDIGAVSPAEIALSVLAQMTAVLHREPS